MLLENLLKSVYGKYKKIPIKGISFDSRKVKKKYVFFSIKGKRKSEIKFIKQAISKKASAIIVNKKFNYNNLTIPTILVNDVRKSLSEACSNFYNKKPKNIIAVTGTNGKSSVANFFTQILNYNNISSASIGTLGISSKKYKKKSNLTTMNPLQLHKSLKILSHKKINNVILEASSHGLYQKRLDNLNLSAGIFTNLSHDHLDYHKNIKAYFNSKMHLFENLLKKKSTIITDNDNKEFNKIKKIAKKKKMKLLTIGTKSGDIRVLNNQYKGNKQIVKIEINSKIFNLKIPLIGYFQTKNLLMSILAAKFSGLDENKILSIIHKIKSAPGRLENVVNLNNNSNVIVDFAHSPDALEQSLVALKKQFKKKILLVFGCGGERDKKKRITMGKIAKKYCKKIFVTDDNPRNENPKMIRKSIIAGCKGVAVEIGNRKKAIEAAIKELEANEILLVAGKGHEKTQDYGKKIISFSDKKVIKEIIKKRKINPHKFSLSNFLARKTFNNNQEYINYNGVSINSKTTKKNNLFFAIRGKNTDGHKFVNEAIKKGAVRAVINKSNRNLFSKKIIKVDNTFSSLNNLAKVTRENTNAKVIGITGSVGKTTLKNLLSFSLSNYGKVYSSPFSYNNKFGVPLSVSNLKKGSEYGVFEIGMDKKGEINSLSKIVKPELAAITNISEAHLKNFKSIKDIAKAKSEIIDNISANGSLILDKDERFFNYFYNKAKKKGIKVTSFSKKIKADIFLLNIKNYKNYYKLKIQIKNKFFYFDIKYLTNSFLKNILSCITILFILKLDLEKMKKKFKNFKIPEGRGDIKKVKKFNKKFVFIDESYNANPLSMTSAINNISNYKKNNNLKKLVFLGDMLELGNSSERLHKQLSFLINRSDIDKVFVYGKYIKQTFNLLSENKKGKIFVNLEQAYNYFRKIINNNDLLMVKGSNATGLNKFSKKIKKGRISVI